MNALVTGASGMLASDLVPLLRAAGHGVAALARAQLDVVDEARVREIVVRTRPDVVFNCAAYSAVDRAESEPEAADAVNGLAVRNLGLACRDTGAILVHFSSDYVFDGTKSAPYRVDDPPSPVNRYGRSKLLGERFAAETGARACIVRTSWLFGPHGPNFVEWVLARAANGEPVPVVDDARGCPTFTTDLAAAAIALAGSGVCGTYHATNRGATTWHGFAAEILRQAGLQATLTPVKSRDLDRPAVRPANSELDAEPLPGILGRSMRPWQEALADYLRVRSEMRARSS